MLSLEGVADIYWNFCFSGAELYEKALASGLDVFRAPEHALIMRWEEKDCQDNELSKTEQMSCEETSKKLHLSASVLQ